MLEKTSDPKVIALMGATATGKTELAVEIAQRFPVELISVDSALIYRQMDIGTAKPDTDTLSVAPHFLINIIDPAEKYSAWDFVIDTKKLIREIAQRGNIPMLVGGTMMYYYAFEQGLNVLPEADNAIRCQIDREAKVVGWADLHRQLAEVDPKTASRVKTNDRQRIQRALEVYRISAKPLSMLQSESSEAYQGELVKVILSADDRLSLHSRIEQRFHSMLREGFIDEVAALKNRGDLNLSMPSMRCVGYRQIWQYLDAELDKSEMIDKAVAATRQLAKRQITWLRKQSQLNSFDCLNYRKDAIFNLLNESFRG